MKKQLDKSVISWVCKDCKRKVEVVAYSLDYSGDPRPSCNICVAIERFKRQSTRYGKPKKKALVRPDPKKEAAKSKEFAITFVGIFRPPTNLST